MAELKGELSDLNPRSILDFGSGPGTAALAVWDVWGMEGGTLVNEDGQEYLDEGEIIGRKFLNWVVLLYCCAAVTWCALRERPM